LEGLLDRDCRVPAIDASEGISLRQVNKQTGNRFGNTSWMQSRANRFHPEWKCRKMLDNGTAWVTCARCGPKQREIAQK
jgi:hypothetical protein